MSIHVIKTRDPRPKLEASESIIFLGKLEPEKNYLLEPEPEKNSVGAGANFKILPVLEPISDSDSDVGSALTFSFVPSFTLDLPNTPPCT